MITPRHTRLVLRFALVAVVLAVLSHSRADPDLWGHVRFGQDILSTHAVALKDTYSFTSDRSWVNHEWLAECAMSAAYAAGGSFGLVALKVLLLVAVVAAVWVVLPSGLPAAAVDLVVGFTIVATIPQASHVRPQLFSLALFAWLLAILVRSMRDSRRGLIAVPILMAVWVNLHGGWIVGAGTLAIWTAIALVSRRPERAPLVAAATASLAGTLVNPYGWRLWRFLYDTVGFGRADIVDWQPVFRIGWAYVALWALAAVAATAALARSRERPDLRATAIVALLAIGSFRVNRLLAFFAIAVAMLFGAAIAEVWTRMIEARGTERGTTSRFATAAALALGAALLAGSAAVAARSATCITMAPDLFPERDAAGVIAARHLDGRMLTWFDWGEYAIWHFAPAVRISIDGRRETVYSDDRVLDHLHFYFDPSSRQRVLDRLRPDFIWLPAYLPVVTALRQDGWTSLYEGPASVLLGRGGTVVRAASPTASEPRCFPGP